MRVTAWWDDRYLLEGSLIDASGDRMRADSGLAVNLASLRRQHFTVEPSHDH